jgi:hypothetical protein
MGELRVRQRLPWGVLLTAAALAGGLLVALRAWPGDATPVPWPSVLALAVAAVAAFLVLRGLQSYLWGVVAGLLLSFHPVLWDGLLSHQEALRAEALELAVLAGVVASWQLLLRPFFLWKAWICVCLVLCAALGTAWPTGAAAGLAASVVAAVGLLAGAVVALRRRRRSASHLPSGWNLVTAAALGLLTPGAGLAMAPWGAWLLDWLGGAGVHTQQYGLDLLAAALRPESPWPGWPAFGAEQLRRWAWPAPVVVLPLMAWGLWRTVRRGLRQTRAGQLPRAWLLTFFAAATLTESGLHPASVPDAAPVALASLAVLLCVFCIADLLRGLTERLVLPPPAGP